MSKYVLCVPRGGLNDTLCQIQRCWEYCERFKRTLLIDTKKSGIFLEFSNFFIDKKNTNFRFEVPSDLICFLNKMDCQISEVDGKIDTYLTEYKFGNYVLENTDINLSFDFHKEYSQSLLIHEQCGGGILSLNLLSNLGLSNKVSQRLQNYLIDGDYDSIHVRNTDYKTDYWKLFYRIKPEICHKKVLVCSDDINVIQCSKLFFSDSEIIVGTSNIFAMDGRPLHRQINEYTDDEKRLLSENAIIDLILIAKSKKIHYSKLLDFNYLSGFTTLAVLLNRNQFILQNLINL